jgi:hypothetical protein
MPNGMQKRHIFGPVITPPACALHGFDVGKPCFPKAQDMLGNMQLLSRFTYGAKCLSAFVHHPLTSPRGREN